MILGTSCSAEINRVIATKCFRDTKGFRVDARGGAAAGQANRAYRRVLAAANLSTLRVARAEVPRSANAPRSARVSTSHTSQAGAYNAGSGCDGRPRARTAAGSGLG